MTVTGARAALRMTAIAAVVPALVLVELSTRSGVSWRLVTFTYQVNLLAAVFYLWSLMSQQADARAGIRGAVVVYVVAAGVVWNLFLTDVSMGYTAANVLLHVVVPVVAVAEWLLIGAGQRPMCWWQPLVWLAYPAAYIGFALLVLTMAGRRIPYYFLDPAAVGGAGVALSVGLLAGMFVCLGYALMALGRRPVTVAREVV